MGATETGASVGAAVGTKVTTEKARVSDTATVPPQLAVPEQPSRKMYRLQVEESPGGVKLSAEHKPQLGAAPLSLKAASWLKLSKRRRNVSPLHEAPGRVLGHVEI